MKNRYGTFLCMLTSAALLATHATRAAQITQASTKWADRVVPMPHEMSITNSIVVPASGIRVEKGPSDAPQVRTALWLLRGTARAGGNAPVKVSMALTGRDKGLPGDLVKRLSDLPNKDQAYAILSRPGADGNTADVTLIANTPVGLLYASRTLTQLLRAPAMVLPDSDIEVPLGSIIDWPDMEERGVWGCGGDRALPWLAQWKLNLVESAAIPDIDVETGEPILTERRPGLIPKGAALGVKVVPYIYHTEIIPLRGSMRYILTKDHLKHLRPALNISGVGEARFDADQGKLREGFCLTSPVTVDLLAGWLMKQAELVADYHNDIEIWFSEGRHIHPKDVDSGKDPYELETAAILKAFERVKAKYPDMRLRIWLSQGSYDSNDKVLAMLPPYVGVSYYDGGRTYITDREPMIYPVLEEYSAKGGWLGVVPQLTASYRTVLPMSSPQFVHFRCTEFVEKQVDSISAYMVLDVRHHEFNVAAMAEWTWNADGRSMADFSRAYATVTGAAEPKLFSEWAINAGRAGYDLAESHFFFPRLWKDPAAGFYGGRSFLDLFEGKRLSDPAHLKNALTCARRALELARISGNWEMINESEFTLACLDAFEALAVVSDVIRAPSVDDAGRRRVAEQLDRIDRAAHLVSTSRFEWYDTMGFKAGLHYRFLYTATVLHRTCDALRNAVASLGIPDPRPESRAADVGEWSNKDFHKPGKAAVAFDVTHLIPPEGGKFHAVFTQLDGLSTRVRTVKLYAAKPDASKRELIASSGEAGYSLGGLYSCEGRLVVPEIPAGTRLDLDVTMTSYPALVSREKPQPLSEGLVSLRRVYERGAFPAFAGADAATAAAAARFTASRGSAGAVPTVKPPDRGKTLSVGVTSGWGYRAIIEAMKGKEGLNVFAVPDVSAASLGKCHVIVVTQGRQSATRLIRGAGRITAWVRNGGGAMFIHDAVGYRAHMAMFKSIGYGSNHPKLDTLRVAAEHPVTRGLSVGHAFSPGFRYDHVVMALGRDGTAVVENTEGDPAVVAGVFGKGRVVLDGLLTGHAGDRKDSGGSPRPPEAEELQILENSIRWLAGGQ